MNVIKLMPVIISFLLLAAHFFRAGNIILAVLCVLLLTLLVLRKTWLPRLFQILLVLGSLEWLRSLYFIASMRIASGEPWTRLVIILGTVALLTALSGLVFRNKGLRTFYRSPG